MAKLFEELSGNLLDLGLRNKLINFKDQKLRSIEIVEPDSDELFSLICEDRSLTFIEPEEEEEKQNEEENSLVIFDEQNAADFKPRRENEIIAHKKGEKYDYILKHLKKFNDSAKIEKGINILYISFGMLHWKEASFSKTDLRSPLLLIPVTLEFDRGDQSFSVKRIEEEIILNPALKAKLEFDFDYSLPDFDREEDTVESYLSKVEESLKEDDWYVSNKAYLGIFSFAKITMYYDLKNNESSMSGSSLIKAIYSGDSSNIDRYFDTNYDNYFELGKDSELFNVVDADSSQIEAILEAKKGKSLVIQGPPGTGKSQTITNIIAELLNDGKKVLFVSEKRAALEVVHTNLKRVGLGDFCFQVHSDKMNKKDFVAELYRVYKDACKGTIDRTNQLNELNSTRSKLDSYSKALYKNIEGLDLKVFDLLNAVHLDKKFSFVDYKVPEIKSKNLLNLAECKDILQKYASYEGPTNYLDFSWFGFDQTKYNYQNDQQIFGDLEWAKDFVDNLKLYGTYFNQYLLTDYSKPESLQDVSDKYHCFLEIPFYDKKLLNKDSRIEFLSILNDYISSYKKLEETKSALFKVFNEEIFTIDINKYIDRFENKYGSIFRIFNTAYKLDKNELAKYSNNSKKKLSYKDIYVGLKNAIQICSLKTLADEKLEKAKAYSNYAYDLSSIGAVETVYRRIKDYNDKYSNLDISLSENADVSDIAKKVYEISRLSTADNFEKYYGIQGYFIKKYVDLHDKPFDFILEKLNKCLSNKTNLLEWVRFSSLWIPIENLGLSDFIVHALGQKVVKKDLADAYSYCFYKTWYMNVYFENNDLKYFRRTNQDLNVEKFKELDKKLIELDRKQIAYSIRNNLYEYVNSSYGQYNSGYSYDSKARRELAILEHEANKKRAIKPIRVMFREISHLLYRIKPCLLMSPLSVATYLAYSPDSFDVVIFDEASQVFPWDAIGAIARSKSVIVVGDSKQMPPTNFFMTGGAFDDEYDEEEEESAADFESILDLCSAVLPQKMLNWHYRSKTESLIAFSNRNFYQNRLITFPSSQHDSDDFGISFHYVDGAVYNNRQNLKEARAVIDLIYDHFNKHPERSLGVVCFSISQQALLEDLLEEKRRQNDKYASLFDQTKNEPFFIKNLETVQGDERDTIIFSIGYGKDAAGNLKHNFGPLNRKGGERRLNVAITRAKFNVHVVSSIHSFDIDLNRTGAFGAKLLKDYLDLAENGLSMLNKDLVVDPNAEADSAFEVDVADAIREAGYDVDLQVGCSGYHIDLAVKHPKNNDYVLAIECDGRTYHSSKNARDRDRLRQEVLERLGWSFYRIWSTDWFINNQNEKQSLIARIEKAIKEYDVKAKEIEEKNRILAEERAKEQFANIKVNERNNLSDESEEKGRFTDNLSAEELKYIEDFNAELKKSNYEFIFSNREYIYAYLLKSDRDSGKRGKWFWIIKRGNTLIFKIKNDPDDSHASKEFRIGKPGGAIKLAQYVIDICDNKGKLQTIPSGHKSVTLDDDDDEDDENFEARQKNENFYFRIARAIQGRRIYCKNFEESKIINEVLEFVMNEISHDAVSKKVFKNREDFNQNKYQRHFTYSLFNVSFSLGNVSTAKAEEIYYYFIASKILEAIKPYEKIFNKQIVSDYIKAMNSFQRIIRLKTETYSSAEGLTSSFSLVPDTVLDDVREKYTGFIL